MKRTHWQNRADNNNARILQAQAKPKRSQPSQDTGIVNENKLADDGDWCGKLRARAISTHIRLRQFHAGTALRGGVYWVRAHKCENQRILPLEESLRTNTTGTTALRRIHFQRGYLRRTILRTRQRFGIARNRQHHSSRRGEQAILAFFIIPCHLAGGNHRECSR